MLTLSLSRYLTVEITPLSLYLKTGSRELYLNCFDNSRGMLKWPEVTLS